MADEHWLDTRTRRRPVRWPIAEAVANRSASPGPARTSSRWRTCPGRWWAGGARHRVCGPTTPEIKEKQCVFLGSRWKLLLVDRWRIIETFLFRFCGCESSFDRHWFVREKRKDNAGWEKFAKFYLHLTVVTNTSPNHYTAVSRGSTIRKLLYSTIIVIRDNSSESHLNWTSFYRQIRLLAVSYSHKRVPPQIANGAAYALASTEVLVAILVGSNVHDSLKHVEHLLRVL